MTETLEDLVKEAETKEETLYVNLYGGPGTGKSTHAAGLFFLEKLLGMNVEYIQEYAKDKTWSEDFHTLSFQPYVTGKQFYRCARLKGKVACAVTDSPILNGLIYQGFGCNEHWERGMVDSVSQFRNIHIFLERNLDAHPYNPKGRSQTEDQAVDKDNEMRIILDKYNIPYHVVPVCETVINEADETICCPTLFAIWRIVKEELGV